MTKFLERLWAVVRRKELVGKDKAGNAFYRHSTTVDGADQERRWVDYVGDPNPRNLPAEWYSWLIGRRKDAPTTEEIMALEAYRQRVKKNAANGVKPPDMNKFIQQVAVLEGVSFDGEDKAIMKKSAEEAPAIEETDRTINASEQGSKKGGQDKHGTQSGKERGDVYEKWVPPS